MALRFVRATKLTQSFGTVDAAFTERALHHHGVEPAAELEADIGVRPDHLEPAFGVKADRAGIGGIADHGDHLPVAARLAFRDQPLQQLQADAAAVGRGLQIDRILHRETVGRPRPIGPRIGIADHAAFNRGNEIGKAAIHQRPEPPGHLGEIGRDQLERRGAVAHRVLVDFGDGGEVGLGGGPDFGSGHGEKDISRPTRINAFCHVQDAPRHDAGDQKKSPGREAGASTRTWSVATSRAGRAAATAA